MDPEYRTEWLRNDLIAGLTLAAYLLPAGLADASLAGLPPEAGLYACLFSGLVFGFFCSSRHTVVTVTTALSLLTGASIGAMSGGDPARHAALAAGLTLILALIAVLAWLIRAGNAVAFFSETVLIGFKTGLAFYLASTQLPKLFGFKGTQGDFWDRAIYFVRSSCATQPTALGVGAVALVVLFAGKLWFKKLPIAFLVVVGGILVARLLELGERGVSLLGPVPQGLPALGLPAVTRADLNELLPRGNGVLRHRHRRKRSNRPDVRAATWLSTRRQPGAAGDRRRQPGWPDSAGHSQSAAGCRSRSSTRARAHGRRSPESLLPSSRW